MPSLTHELPLSLFRECPELVLRLLHDLCGVELPPYDAARVDEADFTQIFPTEFHSDLVIVVLRDGVPVDRRCNRIPHPARQMRHASPLSRAAGEGEFRPTPLLSG